MDEHGGVYLCNPNFKVGGSWPDASPGAKNRRPYQKK
jgi:hypothetical protein